MKNLAYISIILASIAFILGLLEKTGVSIISLVSPVGYIKAASIFLLFGINFELMELLSRK